MRKNGVFSSFLTNPDDWIIFRWMKPFHPAWFIFGILLLNKASLMLNGGEEQYLAYALQHYNPDWVPNSFSVTEFPGTRLLFQTITGFFVYHFGFHATAFAGRVIVFLLMSFPLARIFRHFGFSNLMMLVLLQFFLITKHSFFADEWIFWGFEPKAPAYAFLFWGLFFLLERRYLLMAIALAFSTWFHLLVGGWFFGAAMVLMLFQRQTVRELASTAGLYLAMMLPLLIYLWPLIAAPMTTDSTLNLDRVYVYFRLKHHLGLFDSYSYFIQKHLPGVAAAFIALIWQLYLMRRIKDPVMQTLTRLNVIFLVLAMAFVVAAWADMALFDKLGGLGLKYYPFRMMAVSLLITMMQGFWVLRGIADRRPAMQSIVAITAICTLLLFGARSASTVRQSVKALSPDPEMEALFDVVRSISEPGDVFILLWPEYNTTTSFIRKTARENYVVFKFVPAGTAKLAEWYRRIQVEQEMVYHQDRILSISDAEGISFVISGKLLKDSGLSPVWQSKHYYLYDLRKPNATFYYASHPLNP
jgi:hypothetical protein